MRTGAANSKMTTKHHKEPYNSTFFWNQTIALCEKQANVGTKNLLMGDIETSYIL